MTWKPNQFQRLATAYDLQCRHVVNLELELDKFNTAYNEASLHLSIIQAKSIKTQGDTDTMAQLDKELQYYDAIEFDMILEHNHAVGVRGKLQIGYERKLKEQANDTNTSQAGSQADGESR